MKIHFLRKTKLSNNIYEYYFKKPSNFKYLSGQYCEFSFDYLNPDKRGLSRYFTLSSPANSKYLSFATKHSSTKVSSTYKLELQKMTPGREFRVSEVYGDFVLPKDQTRDLLFIVAGIGVTPILSILRDLMNRNEKRKIYVLYIVRNTNEEVDLIKYQKTYRLFDVIYTDQHNKPINWELIFNFIINNKLQDPLIYISGPDQMVNEIDSYLVSNNVASRNIISDYFDGYDLD